MPLLAHSGYMNRQTNGRTGLLLGSFGGAGETGKKGLCQRITCSPRIDMPRLAALILGALVWMSVKLPVQANEVIVNRDTGRVLWRNSTSETLDVAAYTLRSTSGGFDATSWLSISENYDADS